MATNGQSDPLAVSAVALREILADELGGDYWLNNMADELSIDPRNLYKKLYKQKFITFGVVDSWLTRLGLQHELDQDIGRLHVIPNPRWTQEKWHSYMKERGCI